MSTTSVSTTNNSLSLYVNFFKASRRAYKGSASARWDLVLRSRSLDIDRRDSYRAQHEERGFSSYAFLNL